MHLVEEVVRLVEVVTGSGAPRGEAIAPARLAQAMEYQTWAKKAMDAALAGIGG